MNLQLAMIRKTRAIFSLLLCFNIFAISLYGNLINFADNLHVMTTHQVAIDHHHHDAYSLHLDHDDVNMVHQHAVDYVQNIAVLCDNNLSVPLLKVSRVHLARFEQPASALIETPFRPPQLPA
jgi:hypothetical protein